MREPSKGPAQLDRVAKPKSIEFEVELITPLFGGGAIPREVDEIAWLRPASAKSAIRAWWRIGTAHRYESLEALRKREEALFGSQARYDEKKKPIGGQGVLSVVVQSKKIGTKTYEASAENPLNGAYFPALPMKRPVASLGIPGTSSKIKVTLTLHSLAESDEEELMIGVRLWLTLGGVGARTRRGAGGLGMTEPHATKLDIPTTADGLKAFLAARCERIPTNDDIADIFCVAHTRTVLIGSEFGKAEDAHKALLAAMRDARQDRKHPPDWKRGDWGRSRWPEADAIRFKAARTRDGSEWSHTPKPENKNRYPRMALGLPIVVPFMSTREKPREPDVHNIYGARPGKGGWEKLHRYASPILLRVVRVWRAGTEKYIPVAILTDCTLPHDVRPLVTTESERINPRDVVDEYSVRDHASETLARIEAKYVAAGFKKIEEPS